jgi:FHS family L-fucose permease-like MFS transporter
MGLISEKTNSMAMAMLIPLIAYVYIMYYSITGSHQKAEA